MELKKVIIKPKHVFMLSKVLDKIEFKLEKVNFKNPEEIGLMMIANIIKGMWKAENEVYELINDVYDLIDCNELEFDDFVLCIENIVKSTDFQKAWLRLTK